MQFKFKNKCDLTTLGPFWKVDLVVYRGDAFVCAVVEAILQVEANILPWLLFHATCDVIKEDGQALCSYHPMHSTFQKTDKMEQSLHAFVFV